MSDYTYIDGDNDKLWIDKISAGVILIGTMGASREVDACASVCVEANYAPAIALAILEAAGYGKTEAAGFVRGQVEALVKEAEREAEDAKVDEYRKLLYRATKEGESPATWSDYGESGKQFWRDQYHNARKFFEES